MKTKATVLGAVILAAIGVFAWAGGGSEKSGAQGTSGGPGGTIVVLTHRTDLVDNVLQDYKARFNQKFPNVKVEFEAITDYETTVRTRMNTVEYGDVLMMIANPPIPADFGRFYEPLGKQADLEKTYSFLNISSFGGITYGISPNANVAGGILYNKQVFREVGFATPPKTIEEFYQALAAIKAKLPEVAPIYMNYPSGWTLNAWEGNILSIAGDAEYLNKLAHIDDPFSPGRPHYILYKVMYDVVKNGLCEKDPLTSDWELSKQMLADGKIGCMVLGSWAIGQVKALSKNPEDIAYMPFPYSVKGKLYAQVAPDYQCAINIHSKHKEAARGWVDFMLDDSGYAELTMGIPTKKGAPYPTVLDSFKAFGVNYIEQTPAPSGEEGLTDKIDKEAEIGRWNDPWKKRIVEAALGASKESYDAIMDDLNARWTKARATLGVK